MIRFDGVTKSYGTGPPAVDNLTLEAATGEITVLVGPSGCGKTTTLRMVNRLITPTSGTVSIDGVDTGTMDLTQLRRGIGYVIQQAGLFPHRTVVDNIATVPRLLGWGKSKARARAMELIELVGLAPDLAKRYPASLSGGQQQRVGVARALAADPPIMLMDEPFSAVDPVVRDQLQQEFLKIQAELGKTTLFVTHDIDEAIKLGDHVAVLRVGGHLAQFAEPEKLLSDPVDDFVAEFVGRDRGYRALAFTNAPGLTLRDEPTIPLGATPTEVQAVGAEWVLALDEDKAPVGWVRTAAVDRPVDRTLLHRGGTVARIDGSLRALLDAALSSPSGRGVVAGPDGHFAGVVLAADVLGAIERERDEHRASPTQPGSAAYDLDEREAST